MKVTIEHDGKTDVYEDVRICAGAFVMDVGVKGVGVKSVSVGDFKDKTGTEKMILCAAAAKGLRTLLGMDQYAIAENLINAICKASGEEMFEEKEEVEE